MKKFLLLICVLLALCSCQNKPNKEITIEPHKDKQEEITEVDEARLEEYKVLNAAFDENYHITHDFRGFIKVGNLVDLPFVQGKSNDTYLRKDWYTMNYDEEGSIFLDSNNYLDDQNLIIYGHYVYHSYEPSGTHKFTPLDKLIDEKNYEDNKYITLQLESEIRTYEIGIVFYIDTYVEDGVRYTYPGYVYYYPNYPDDYFDEYIKNAYDAAFYDTGVEITKEDKLLTLQTCVEGKENLREIIVAKQISIERTR